jgi:phosphoadenosine phosphosulfate reductase
MLVENTLFGKHDLVELSILRLREFEKQACDMHPDGYWVAFSGGKDSIVVLDLVRKAGVKHTAHFNVTTVDPPELLAFIREHYADVHREKPDKSMFQLIREKMMPPTRIVRYCCEYLKERGGKDRFVVTGIRWAESARRSKRRMTETCFRSSRKRYLNPIIEWSDADVWQYIRENKLPYCRLYDEGFARIGCVGCPMAGKGRLKEFARWPRFEAAYRKAFSDAAAAARIKAREDGWASKHPLIAHWNSGDDMWDWWMNEDRMTSVEDSDQGVLFE